MDNKVRIGSQTDELQRAMNAEQYAQDAKADLTMMQRRVRTFYMAVSEIVFPEGAPSWAPDWVEWLLTGEVAPVVEEVVEEATANEAVGEAAVSDEIDAAASQADMAAGSA